MTPHQAKQILLLYRPGTADAQDPQVAEALELSRQDADLGRWFEEHRAFQQTVRRKLQEIEVPSHLKDSLLIRHAAAPPNIHPLPGTRSRQVLLAIAALIVVVLGLAVFLLQPASPDQFANFQSRMVSTALREYRMDIVTNDMPQLRQFLVQRGAPGDYSLTPGLEKLQLTGGGRLQWRSKPVSMVCFDRGDKQMLFLFVINRSALKDAPGDTPQVATISTMQTVSWTRGEYTYVLTGPEDAEFLQKYL